jgi:DNA-binding GntR family transcriptional regulator
LFVCVAERDKSENPLAGLDVQLESTAAQVAGALREAIINGSLPQGTYLREVSLSERFSVSRNTIREATQILVGERLVTRKMHRGAYVSRLVSDDVHDLYRVRRIVELPAISQPSGVDRERLRASVGAFAQAIDDDDRTGIVAADLQFHRTIVESMSSDRLGALFESLEGELRLCMALVGGEYPKPGVSLREHEQILAALDEGSSERARELLAAHLDGAERAITAVLAEREAASSSSA